jgi:hypothetical protein
MLIDYLQAAMRRARYEMLHDGEGFVGTIRGFRGVIGDARSLEDCREDLHNALQSWLLVKLRQGDRDLPTISGIDLRSPRTPRKAHHRRSSAKAA